MRFQREEMALACFTATKSNQESRNVNEKYDGME